MTNTVFFYVTVWICYGIYSTDSVPPIPTFPVGNCPPLSEKDIGTRSRYSETGFITKALRGLLPGNLINNMSYSGPLVQVLNYTILCEVPGLIRNTFSQYSVLVDYLCSGYFCNTNDPFYAAQIRSKHQFTFICDQGTNTFYSDKGIKVQNGNVIKTSPTANLSSPLRKCGSCSDIHRNPHHCGG